MNYGEVRKLNTEILSIQLPKKMFVPNVEVLGLRLRESYLQGFDEGFELALSMATDVIKKQIINKKK